VELNDYAGRFAAALGQALAPLDIDGPTPVVLAVPAAEVAAMVAGEPRFDAAMALSAQRGRAGVLVIPTELDFGATP
jgi:hypothetical protein